MEQTLSMITSWLCCIGQSHLGIKYEKGNKKKGENLKEKGMKGKY
jgi:hypothetical protein